MESWAKKERIRQDRPLYKDLTPKGIEAKENELFDSKLKGK